ncbi:MAG TPA: DUF488 family protein [Pseudonocardiaceae bacterium]|nr:DUF488 family protein [Pseudonocardiaceae bacterium]
MAGPPQVKIGRIYDPPMPADGVRVLVDRVWPRGLRKDAARIDEWCKQVAPSTELRRWYAHDPHRFAEFARRYRAELDDPRWRAGAPARAGPAASVDVAHRHQKHRTEPGSGARTVDHRLTTGAGRTRSSAHAWAPRDRHPGC